MSRVEFREVKTDGEMSLWHVELYCDVVAMERGDSVSPITPIVVSPGGIEPPTRL